VNHRTYTSAARCDAAEILSDIVTAGLSEGWGGSLERLEALRAILAAFNVIYADDMRGRWQARQ